MSTGVISEVARLLEAAQDREAVLRAIITDICRVLGADACAVNLLTDLGDALQIAGATGYDPALIAKWTPMPLEMELPGPECVRTNRPLFFTSRDQLIDWFPTIGYIAASGHERTACLPLRSGDHVFGALAISSNPTGDFTEAEQTLLMEVAGLCSEALQRTA